MGFSEQMNITLRAHERLFINGAVIRADRRVTLELLNDVVFLLENHVMQAAEATTPLRQIYFVTQVILMEGRATEDTRKLASEFVEKALSTVQNQDLIEGLGRVRSLFERERYFEVLKSLRLMYPLEARELEGCDQPKNNAA